MTNASEPTFTQSVTLLEAIIQQFRAEGASLSLEEALNLFEQGVQHVQVCQKTLTSAKGKVEILSQNLQVEPFNEGF